MTATVVMTSAAWFKKKACDQLTVHAGACTATVAKRTFHLVPFTLFLFLSFHSVSFSPFLFPLFVTSFSFTLASLFPSLSLSHSVPFTLSLSLFFFRSLPFSVSFSLFLCSLLPFLCPFLFIFILAHTMHARETDGHQNVFETVPFTPFLFCLEIN